MSRISTATNQGNNNRYNNHCNGKIIIITIELYLNASTPFLKQ